MRRLSWAVLAFPWLFSCVAPAPAPVAVNTTRLGREDRPNRKERVRQILPHNVRLYLYEGDEVKKSASGVVVASEAGPKGAASYVVTNAHAVDLTGLKGAELKVVVEHRADAQAFPAEILATGKVPELDLALVRVRGVTLQPAELAADDELELGDDVLVVGAPYGKAISLSGGMVSQLEWDPGTGAPMMLKTDAPIGYGASGGGVFSLSSGKLLAIVEGYRTARVGFAVAEQAYSFDVPMPGETFAAPTSKVRSFLGAKGFAKLVKPRLGGAANLARAAAP